jgi:predicted dehydrogenase
MTRIAVIGYGYWGPNIVRNIARFPAASISWICDLNPETFRDIPRLYPAVKTTTSVDDVFADPDTSAVIIATPPATHFLLARRAILSGKHVLVEKPMTQSVKDAGTLIALARKRKKILMVDHTYIYTPAVRYLKKLIRSKTLGTIYSIDSVRTNLGILQKDSNVIADLAVHDFSIVDYLFGRIPETVSATGIAQKELRQETVAHIAAHYKNGLFLHCHVSWLSPIKIRRMIFVGTKRMVVYDDIEPTEKIKIYDKGVSVIKDPRRAHQLRVGYRNGDVLVPNITIEEGLYGMVKEFIRAIGTGRSPL